MLSWQVEMTNRQEFILFLIDCIGNTYLTICRQNLLTRNDLRTLAKWGPHMKETVKRHNRKKKDSVS